MMKKEFQLISDLRKLSELISRFGISQYDGERYISSCLEDYTGLP